MFRWYFTAREAAWAARVAARVAALVWVAAHVTAGVSALVRVATGVSAGRRSLVIFQLALIFLQSY